MRAGFYGCSSDILGHNLTANSLIVWFLQSFWSIFCRIPWQLGAGMLHWFLPIWKVLHNSAFWLIVVFLKGFSLLQWKFPWWEVKTALICGYNDKSYGLLPGFIYPWLKWKSIAIVPLSTIILIYHVRGGLCPKNLSRSSEEMKKRLSKSWSQVASAFSNRVIGAITRNLNPFFYVHQGWMGLPVSIVGHSKGPVSSCKHVGEESCNFCTHWAMIPKY